MPGLDDRLEQAVRGAALLPDRDPDAITAAVAVKRRHRRARRHAVTGLAVAMVVVAALTTTVVVVTDRDANDVQVATNERTPTTTTAPPPPAVVPGVEPPDDPEAASDAIADTVSRGFEVGKVTFLAPNEALVEVVADDGAIYTGVRMQQMGPDQWTFVANSACRVPGLDTDTSTCADLGPEVLVTPGKTRLGPDAYSGTPAAATPLVPTVYPGYLPGPVLAVDDMVVTAAHDRNGATYTEFPSRVVTIVPASGAVTTLAELEGTVLSLAEGEGALWAVTRDQSIDMDQVEYRVKRVTTANELPGTMPIPPGRVPAGDVIAGSGSVWVPVRDGVLVYDPATGALTETIDLPVQDRRGLAILGDAVYVTDGSALRRIDADGTLGDPVATTAEWPLIDMVATDGTAWALASDGELLWLDAATASVAGVGALPPEMRAPKLHVAGAQVWASGEADLAPPPDASSKSVAAEPVMVVLDDSGIAGTVVLAGATDAETTFTSTGELILLSGGTAYRATLPE